MNRVALTFNFKSFQCFVKPSSEHHLLPPRSATAALFIGSNIEYGEDVDWIHVDMLAPSHCEVVDGKKIKKCYNFTTFPLISGRSTAWGVSLIVAALGKATAVPLLQTLGQ
ncbi:hypothetical protein PRIPAC_70229 [Pristionchus pacificus]|uniref:Uncharacterized protein n=1 Tax=Pristionchus pacificus TaxID=54126 RepID=A0A2A6C4Y0_PRIPA|nr:hypothetical protein PRIPAC_70229 [Pristionchus pacificus]|eukprot:PDM73224.1 hypothetical protein PRIPAC_40580 [Pristionchus pacificus]